MTEKYVRPLPEKLPPEIPEYVETRDEVFEQYRMQFEEVFTSPKFIAAVEALGDNPIPTGNFWLDRFFAAKMVQEHARNDPDVVSLPLWDIAAANEAIMHSHGISAEQRLAAAVFKN